MVRSELIAKLFGLQRDMPRDVIIRAVDVIFDTMMSTLAENGRVELRDFGSFWVTSRDGGRRRNPRTGEEITVAPNRAVRWRTGKWLAASIAEAGRANNAQKS